MQKCEFLNKSITVREDSDAMPLDNGVESVSKIGKELVKSYVELAKKGAFLSNKHKEKCSEFFKKSMGMEMPSQEEFSNMQTEDLTFPNNTSLYTTIVRNIVERAFRPELVMNDIIKTITVNPSGVTSVKIPISVLKTAASLPTTGVLPSPTGGNYTDETITLGWIYAYEVITLQLIQQGIIDIVQDQMFEIGDALARKVDSDIIAAIETASPASGANSNYVALGGTTAMSYTALVDGIMNHVALNAKPDAIVTNPLSWANFLKDSSVITALGYNSVDNGSVFPRIQDFLGLKVVLSTQASAKNLYIVDTARCKYLIEGSAVQMLDGRKGGTVNWEVIGLKLYGVKVIQPEAVYRIVENTA